LSQWWTPPIRLQVSACSTFLMMCDVPSMAVFCRESIECCPGIVSRYSYYYITNIVVVGNSELGEHCGYFMWRSEVVCRNIYPRNTHICTKFVLCAIEA
jgi:hypothetical protein